LKYKCLGFKKHEKQKRNINKKKITEKETKRENRKNTIYLMGWPKRGGSSVCQSASAPLKVV
jgi:hypothetical protein